ncbi:hypothetical protein [Paraflavitalea speifideaquila]|uniref:hypothetical protein n=1 Tax=Paraflavitalea speifideaquila TaxID=3076558 RepID=UPI0028EFFD10|nr:hypothetical protein [Paraflavitalea speifideiaquila]
MIFALAKFKKEADAGLIGSKIKGLSGNAYCNDHIFRAIEVFPDSSFFPVLQQYFDQYIKTGVRSVNDELDAYCKSLASYKNKSALKILTALTKISTYPDTWNFSDIQKVQGHSHIQLSTLQGPISSIKKANAQICIG